MHNFLLVMSLPCGVGTIGQFSSLQVDLVREASSFDSLSNKIMIFLEFRVIERFIAHEVYNLELSNYLI